MKNLNEQGVRDKDEIATDRALVLVRRLVEKIERQLDQTDAKGSIADYVKLLQLQKELEEKRIRRIEVKWVDAE